MKNKKIICSIEIVNPGSVEPTKFFFGEKVSGENHFRRKGSFLTDSTPAHAASFAA